MSRPRDNLPYFENLHYIHGKLYGNEPINLNLVLDNIRSVLEEDPEDLEFDLYTPLCDTAIYYFIEDVEEFNYDDYTYLKGGKSSNVQFEVMSTEELNLDFEDEEEEDCLTEEGLNFWEHCSMIGLRLKPIDCL